MIYSQMSMMLSEDFEFGYCLDFGSPDENADPCRENCEDTGTDFFRSYRLNQYPPGVSTPRVASGDI